MQIKHKKFGLGDIINTTEEVDADGNIIAADVMFKHGVERIDELRGSTLKSYLDGALKDRDRHQNLLNKHRDLQHFGNEQPGAIKYHGSAVKKRNAGIERVYPKLASKIVLPGDESVKIAKEEIEMTENKYDIDHDVYVVMPGKGLENRYFKSETAARAHMAELKGKKGHDPKYYSQTPASMAALREPMPKFYNDDMNEKLVGNQKKIDVNKNGKIDAEDFKKLHKEENEMTEKTTTSQRVTPDTAASRMPGVENVAKSIMSHNRDLRQEAKEAAFKAGNK